MLLRVTLFALANHLVEFVHAILGLAGKRQEKELVPSVLESVAREIRKASIEIDLLKNKGNMNIRDQDRDIVENFFNCNIYDCSNLLRWGNRNHEYYCI